jgi:hypothetical protein
MLPRIVSLTLYETLHVTGLIRIKCEHFFDAYNCYKECKKQEVTVTYNSFILLIPFSANFCIPVVSIGSPLTDSSLQVFEPCRP